MKRHENPPRIVSVYTSFTLTDSIKSLEARLMKNGVKPNASRLVRTAIRILKKCNDERLIKAFQETE